jgi:hypothetical protein
MTHNNRPLILKTTTRRWLLAALFTGIGAALVIFSPAEQTLGEAVKVVYVHVALSRAGGIGLLVAGLIGIAVLITDGDSLDRWLKAAGIVALAIYALGFIVSIAAQALSWGGIAWREPRVAAALNGLAVGLIVVILAGWVPWRRLRGARYVGLAAFIAWTQMNATNILHPGSAISSSPSGLIRFTGLALLVLTLIAGAWVVWEIASSKPAKTGV